MSKPMVAAKAPSKKMAFFDEESEAGDTSSFIKPPTAP
jgi:hypothetical protein